MKKSIIYLGLALTIFTNVAMASNIVASSTAFTITQEGTATPLATAIVKGDIASVKAFIAYGADVNEKCNDMTPLMYAARYNRVEIMNLLLQNGASLKQTNSKGFNALKYAQLSNAKEAITAITQETTAIALNKKQPTRRTSI